MPKTKEGDPLRSSARAQLAMRDDLSLELRELIEKAMAEAVADDRRYFAKALGDQVRYHRRNHEAIVRYVEGLAASLRSTPG